MASLGAKHDVEVEGRHRGPWSAAAAAPTATSSTPCPARSRTRSADPGGSDSPARWYGAGLGDDRDRRDPRGLRGATTLAADAVLGLVDVVEAMHGGISPLSAWRRDGRTVGVTALVYGSIRAVTRLAAGSADAALGAVAPLLREPAPSARREALLAALNGVAGDHLAATGNSLATPLRLRHQGRDLPPAAEAMRAAVPDASGRVALLVHGLCRSDSAWSRDGHDPAGALCRDLGRTAVHVRYNSGRHVSVNGRALAAALEGLVARWPVPVEELAIFGHSMGGLVARSACHYAAQAGHGWLRHLRDLVFLGTPHHGAPLERGGLWFQRALGGAPWAGPLARLGRLRSAGITDLRHGNLLDEDWQGSDRFAPGGDERRPVPLPPGVRCYAVAALCGSRDTARARLVGDGLVPLDSALGRHRDPVRTLPIPPERQWVGRGLGHLDLLSASGVWERAREWLAD